LSATDIISMLECLIDNIFVRFGGRLFQHSRYTYKYKLCSFSRRLVPLFVWGSFIQELSKKNETKLSRSFNFTFRYLDDILSLNNSRFGDFVHYIYPIELEIKQITTDTDRYASYLDLHLYWSLFGQCDIFCLSFYFTENGTYQLPRRHSMTYFLWNLFFL
jgi:hypothetical protein